MRWDQSMLKEGLSGSKRKITKLTVEGNHKEKKVMKNEGEVKVVRFLVTCTRLYKSLCRSVGPSPFTFFCIFELFEG